MFGWFVLFLFIGLVVRMSFERRSEVTNSEKTRREMKEENTNAVFLAIIQIVGAFVMAAVISGLQVLVSFVF